MTTVRDIYNALFAFAPASMKMDWDNVGLLCGRFDAPVDTVLVALDPMPDVIDEAKKTGAQCIVTHHPLFFDAPRAVNDASYEGRSWAVRPARTSSSASAASRAATRPRSNSATRSA